MRTLTQVVEGMLMEPHDLIVEVISMLSKFKGTWMEA